MKKLNLFSNLWSSLVGSRKDNGSTRLRVVFDSFTCRLRVCPLKLVSVLTILLTIGVGNVWGTNASITEFSTTSGSIDTHISYAAYKGKGTTDPAVSSKTLRIYKPSSGESAGGYITVTAASGYQMSSITFTNADDKAGSYCYSVDGGSLSSSTSIAKKATFTYNSTTFTSISFYNCGSDRLSIAGISVTYSSSSSPSITTSSSMTTFGCNMTTGVPTAQNFSVSGSNLSENLTVTPPSGYEICLTSGGTYQTSAISLTPSTGAVSSTTIYVRLKSTNAAGSYSGNIVCASTGATTQNVAISGSTPFTVIWIANTDTIDTTYVTYASGAGTALGTLPDEPDPDDYACTGKEFYGWYDGDSYSNASVAPTIITPSTKITSDETFSAVFATASGSGTRTVSANLSTLKSAVSDISSGYSSKTFEMTYSDESYTFTADVTKSVQTSTSGWLQVGKFPSDGRYMTITDEFPGRITNISSENIYNGGNSAFTGIVYYNTSASIETPIATDTLSSASSFSMDIKGGSTGGYFLFNTAICLGDLSVTYSTTTYSDYNTTCCANLITLSTPTITDAASSGSTVTYTESSPVATCSGAATVHVTVSPEAGYQATSISFGGTATNTGISPSVSVPLNSEQEYAISYAKNTTSGTLAPSVTFAAKPLNSISLSATTGTVYVDQYVDFTVSYDPSDYLSKGYTLTATPTYVTKVSQAPANTLLRLKGGRSSGAGASITTTQKETVTIQASGDNTKTTSVTITVNPLPKVHFVDIVHGIEFDDVVATIEENELVEDQPTPTHDDISSPGSSNTCENTHLHLIGWIDSEWSGVTNYLNNITATAPDTDAIKAAGSGVWITAGADIDTDDKDGKTYYAVWAAVE